MNSIIYSENFAEINSARFAGWGVHLLCLSGEGWFSYNGRRIRIRKNDALVLSRPDLVADIVAADDLKVEFIAAPFKFMYSLLPANHYGISGCISLFDDPVIPLSESDAVRLRGDFGRLRERLDDTQHLFYDELIGSLALTMIYDLFDFHAKLHENITASEPATYIIRRLLSMLEGGRSKIHREVKYYADELHVSAKYLSDVVRRNTGMSVTCLIDRHTVGMIADYLKNSDMTLSQISEEMNFKSLSYFSRYVRKHLGMSPSEYRAANPPAIKK